MLLLPAGWLAALQDAQHLARILSGCDTQDEIVRLHHAALLVSRQLLASILYDTDPLPHRLAHP